MGKSIEQLISELNWHAFGRNEIVAFDTETTGFKKETDHIIEIAAIRIKSSGEITRYNALINHKVEIPEVITELTGITKALIDKEGVPFYVGFGLFKDFVGKSDICAYNAKFDKGFVDALTSKYNIKFTNFMPDTMLLCRKAFKLSGSKLADVAAHLGYEYDGAHRAMFDCELTAKCHLSALITLQNTPERGES